MSKLLLYLFIMMSSLQYFINCQSTTSQVSFKQYPNSLSPSGNTIYGDHSNCDRTDRTATDLVNLPSILSSTATAIVNVSPSTKLEFTRNETAKQIKWLCHKLLPDRIHIPALLQEREQTTQLCKCVDEDRTFSNAIINY